jgi:hypothetical protein
LNARHRRAVYQPGQDDAISDALALVLTPFLMGLVGLWLDSMFGTRPILIVALAAFGVVASFTSAYYRYHARIAAHDQDKPWNRKASA